ncbi:MAG: hypothetical protein NT061_04710 [Spirochaetes bacterium]|nr:hypothetical protein [Spirochaetota bacterium]
MMIFFDLSKYFCRQLAVEQALCAAEERAGKVELQHCPHLTSVLDHTAQTCKKNFLQVCNENAGPPLPADPFVLTGGAKEDSHEEEGIAEEAVTT